jgi:acyl-CoA synthetase (AMP-forming)/AMP-acid ligase II
MEGINGNSEAPPVWLSPSASAKTKELWFLHGHPQSKRFSNPELTSLASLIRHNAKQVGSDIAFFYPTSAGDKTGFSSITWVEFDRCTNILASRYSKTLHDILVRANATIQQPCVALWGAGHTIEYFATQMALAKLNVKVLLLADSAPVTTVTHLLNVTKAELIIADQQHERFYNQTLVIPMEQSLPFESEPPLDTVVFHDGKDPWERPAFIIHSSGSTGLPKPITHTNRSLMQIARMYRLFPEFHVENWLLLFPLYARFQ